MSRSRFSGRGRDNFVFQGFRTPPPPSGPPPCKGLCTFWDFTWFLTKAISKHLFLAEILFLMFDGLFPRWYLPNAPELRYMYQLRIEVHLLHVCCAFNFNISIMGIHLSRHVASFIKTEGGGKTTPNKQKQNLTSPIIKFQINYIISRENLFRKKVEGLLHNLLPIYTWWYVSDYKLSNTTHQWRPELQWFSLHSTFVKLLRCPKQLPVHVYFVIVSFSTGEGRIRDFF